MGLHVLTDNLQDVVMSEMEELVDYEDSEKVDQRWTDDSEESNPLADESGNNGDNPNESLVATTKASDQMIEDAGEEILVVSEPFNFVNVEMSEVYGPPKDNKPQGKTVDEIR